METLLAILVYAIIAFGWVWIACALLAFPIFTLMLIFEKD